MNKIESMNNQYIKSISKLKDKKYILKDKKYLVEGKNVIQEAISAGVVETILVTKKELYTEFENRVLIEEDILKKLTTNISNEGAIAVCEIVETKFDLNSFERIVILDQVNNPGNLGSIIRTTKAMGFDAVITLGNSVFKWNSKVISGSQGTIFNFPVIQLDELKENIEHKNFLFQLEDKSTKLDNIEMPKGKFSLIFGNEANGISKEVENILKGDNVFIPINGVESLSLNNAVAIATYKFRR